VKFEGALGDLLAECAHPRDRGGEAVGDDQADPGGERQREQHRQAVAEEDLSESVIDTDECSNHTTDQAFCKPIWPGKFTRWLT